jgi:hypothetical protein
MNEKLQFRPGSGGHTTFNLAVCFDQFKPSVIHYIHEGLLSVLNSTNSNALFCFHLATWRTGKQSSLWKSVFVQESRGAPVV